MLRSLLMFVLALARPRTGPGSGLAVRVLCLATMLLAAPVHAAEPADRPMAPSPSGDRNLAAAALFYLPNRLFDVLDTLRLRARVGPGFALRARATEGLDLGFGSYAAVYAGVPGPRGGAVPSLPVGFETYSGVEVGPGDVELSAGFSPDYSPTEFGASLQMAMVGVDVGLDPLEIVDLLAGLILIDLRGDDL